MTADRCHMLPRLFEAIACLRENEDWWSDRTVQEMLAGSYEGDLKKMYEEDYRSSDVTEFLTGIPDTDGDNEW
jgi:hypothetical protein